MSLRRFLAPPGFAPGQTVTLAPEEAAHARKVLRLAAGDQVWLLDGRGMMARAEVASLDKAGAACRVLEVASLASPRPRLVLCPGLLKGPAMDLLAVKLTELMADEVRPFLSRRSAARLDDAGGRLDRWERLAGQALKQCGAARLPAFFPPAAFGDLVAQAPAGAARLMLYEDEAGLSLAQALPGLAGAEEVWALVGPEGGFTPAEADLARAAGWTVLGLGPTILRAETAGLALAAVVRLAWPGAANDLIFTSPPRP